MILSEGKLGRLKSDAKRKKLAMISDQNHTRSSLSFFIISYKNNYNKL